MKTADEFLSEGATTFKARNAVYGNNYLNVGKAMAALFPNGVTLKTADDHNRFHIFMLGVVKLSRYANNWDAGGHADSMHDNTVYSAMLESIDKEIAERPPAIKIDGKHLRDRCATFLSGWLNVNVTPDDIVSLMDFVCDERNRK